MVVCRMIIEPFPLEREPVILDVFLDIHQLVSFMGPIDIKFKKNWMQDQQNSESAFGVIYVRKIN